MDKKLTKLYISLGTSSAEGLLKVKEKIDALEGKTCNVQYIAADTNESIHSLKGKNFFTFCAESEELKGQGSGMRMKAAYDAFMESKDAFLIFIFEKIAPADEIIVASILGAPGRGGTAAGMAVPVCMALRQHGILTMNYHIQPPIVAPGSGADPKQVSYSKHALDQAIRHGIKTFVIDESWIYKQEKIGENAFDDEMCDVLYEHIARAMTSMFRFWTSGSRKSGKGRLAFTDRSDLRTILQGDGFLKFADVKVNLRAPNPSQEIERAFGEIKNHNLYKFPDGEISAVVPFIYGKWGTSHVAELRKQIANFATSRNNNTGYFRKEVKSELPGAQEGEGHLAVFFATAAVINTVPEEDLPDFESEAESLGTAEPDKAKPTAAIGRVKALNRTLTHSYRTFRALVDAATAGERDKDAVTILSQGDPFQIKDIPVRDSRSGAVTSLFWFKIEGSDLGGQLMEYMDSPSDLEKDRHNRDRILLERLEVFNRSHKLSPQWEALLLGSISQALAEHDWQLPRYIINRSFQRKALPSVDADALRSQSLEWKGLRRKEIFLKKGQYPLAQMVLVRVVMQEIFGAENRLFLELIEPEDSRTNWQMLRDESVQRVRNLLPASLRRLLTKRRQSTPLVTTLELEQPAPSAISPALLPEQQPPALETVNRNLLTEPAPQDEIVVSHEVAELPPATPTIH